MTEPLINMPEIAVGDFLSIFISATMILVFGVFYAAIVTLVKMQKIKKINMIFAYLFWSLQLYSTYFLTVKIHSQPFTTKVMIVVMTAYLVVPHIYYYLISKSEERYENT
jgi:hypothetical protein